MIDELGVDAFARAVIAYEPVWAIGTLPYNEVLKLW
ncbi:MAG: triose-phosphate isomerase [Candidatus Arsenophonus phytopathogenicus]